jgi:hypothetical protein
MIYAAELTVADVTFARVAISTPSAEPGKIDVSWYDMDDYDRAQYIVTVVKGRNLIEARAKEEAFGGGILKNAEPDAIQTLVGRGDVVAPKRDQYVAEDPDATVRPA